MDTLEALATLQRVLGADPDVVDRDELTDLVRCSARLRALLDGFDVRCSRRAGKLADAGRAEAPSSLLGRHGNRSHAEARRIARREHIGRQMPAFEEAMGSGEVSAEHLDVIAKAGTGLPDDVRLEFNTHETGLLGAAKHESVEAFTRRCRDLVRRITAGLAGPDESDAGELERQRNAASVKRWTDQVTGMCHTHLELDPVRDAEVWSAIDAHICRIRADGDRTRSWIQLQVQAVVDTVSAGVTTDSDTDDDTDADTGPRHRARPPRPAQRVPEITVLIGLDVLVDGADALGTSITGICETIDGRQLPVSTVRRMCCDAEILPAVLDSTGEVTDLGRSHRTANRAQRRHLAAMHRTCAHPDCTIGFSACRIHHVKWWWRDLGRTDIDNLLPLCEHHHHLVHEGGWNLTLTPDCTATWTRPDHTHWHTGPTIDRPITDGTPGTRRATDPPLRSRSETDRATV